jgi:hypothetical protein
MTRIWCRDLPGQQRCLSGQVAAHRGRGRGSRNPDLGNADRDDMSARASHRAGVEIDLEVALAQYALLDLASGTGASTSTSRSASSAGTGPLPYAVSPRIRSRSARSRHRASGLLIRLGVVELQAVSQLLTRLLVDCRDRVDQPL